jgi:hypothetical protein
MTGDEQVVGEPRKRKKARPCERCGNFGKRARLGERRWCLECLDRCDPIEREPIGVVSLASATLALAMRSAPRLLVPTLAFGIVVAVIDLQFEASAATTAVGAVLGGLWGLVAVSLRVDAAMSVVEGRVLPSMGELFAAAGRRMGGLFRLQLMSTFVVAAWSLLLVIPGIMRALDLALAPAIFVLEREGEVSAAMSESTARMRGHRMTVMLASLLVLTGPLVVVMLVAALLPSPETQAGATIVLNVCMTFAWFTYMALYLKLRWAAARAKLAPA